jgi:flagellum-specific ATP synthase
VRVPAANFEFLRGRVADVDTIEACGRVQKVVGLVIESSGPVSKIGDLCVVKTDQKVGIFAEVVGFRGNHVLLMPLGEMTGVQAGCVVCSTGECLRAPTGSGLLGRVLDGLGRPLDGRELPASPTYPVLNSPPNALQRKVIHEPLPLGVRSIDSMLTCGVGQRVGIFSGSGVGKSTLLGMIARNAKADVNVIALVGERGREVREFIENDLGDGLERSVIVVATSDQPAMVRIKAAFTATAIAESFRDRGASVLLMMDSVTRFAMAQREVGLAIGEPPSTKGYTPSVFALMPKLMERAGNSDVGSITALYTILVEGDDTNEPIADTARSILDGHIVLDRKLSNSGHYPPVDVMSSLSRVMPMIVPRDQIEAANRVRELISGYRDVEDLVSIGAYKVGSNPLADASIEKWPLINEFLRQNKHEAADFAESAQRLREVADAGV